MQRSAHKAMLPQPKWMEQSLQMWGTHAHQWFQEDKEYPTTKGAKMLQCFIVTLGCFGGHAIRGCTTTLASPLIFPLPVLKYSTYWGCSNIMFYPSTTCLYKAPIYVWTIVSEFISTDSQFMHPVLASEGTCEYLSRHRPQYLNQNTFQRCIWFQFNMWTI